MKELTRKSGKPPRLFPSFLISFFSVSLFFFGASESQADTLLLHPSGKSSAFASVGTWTFNGGTDATALDSNDGDTSYVDDSALNDKLYMEMDDPPVNISAWSINSVQVVAVARCVSCDSGIQLGLRAGPTDTADRLGPSKTVKNLTYQAYLGSLYTTNPRTGAAWNWSDINSLIAIIVHANNSPTLRVTELFVQVNYSRVIHPSGKNALSNAPITGTGTIQSSATLNGSGTISSANTTGSGTISSSGTTVTGSGTSFTTQLKVGTMIAASGQVRTVTAIATGTSLMVDTAFSPTLSGASFVFSPTGSGAISSSGTTVTGTITSFTTQLKVGYLIGAQGQFRFVTAIASNTSLMIDSAFSPDIASGTSFTYSSNTIPGSGTSFNTQIGVGDTITAGGQTRTVTAVASATSLTVNQAFSPILPPGAGYTVTSANFVIGTGTLFLSQLSPGIPLTAAGQSQTIGAVFDDTTLRTSAPFSPALPPGTPFTYTLPGWTFFPSGSEATALDNNDGDTSYATSSALGDKLYMDLDDISPAPTQVVTGVQLFAVARCVALPCNLEVGLRTNGTDFVKSFGAVSGTGAIYSNGGTSIQGSATKFTVELGVGSLITANGQTRTVVSIQDDKNLTINTAFSPNLSTNQDNAVPFTFMGGTLSYQQFNSDFFPKNPLTGAAWTWTDINNLIAVVNHAFNANELRITELYASVRTLNPVFLSYSPDAGYGSSDGVNPDSGGAATSFTYKIVYTNLNNNPPASINVFIDGDGGHPMTRDAAAQDPAFYDLDYTNGEQYSYTTTLPQGGHTYSFAASDATDGAQKPIAGTLLGPSVNIPGGSLNITPSGQNIQTFGDWAFRNATAATALDTNDGDTTYVEDSQPQDPGDTLYLDMDDFGFGSTILSVQVTAVMRYTSNPATVRIGLRLNGTDYLSEQITNSYSPPLSVTYTSFSPSSVYFTTNPDTGKPWTWQDINNMVGVIRNDTKENFRVTQFYVTVVHSPVNLSFSPEIGYGADGVNPDSGSGSTVFQYKIIYKNANGAAPAAGSPKVHIDGAATGVAMTLDTAASDPTLRDGNYIDGEQYVYTAPAGYTTGIHTYYFDASDGTSSAAFPASAPTTPFNGPAVSLPAGAFNLSPSGLSAGSSGWVFCHSGFNCPDKDIFVDPATALDTNDGDATFARSDRNDEVLFMTLDNSLNNGQYITSVQVQAVVRDEGTRSGFTLGLYSIAQATESAPIATTGSTYTTYSGDVYAINPNTGASWTWSDIQNLIVVIRHVTNNSKIRVTQLYVVVNYAPIRLSHSKETGYVLDGVDPDLGNTTTPFKFKIVYTQINNVAPGGTCSPTAPRLHIDGNPTGVCMAVDAGGADPTLRDGNYANGEQYVYTATLAQGSHTYYFDASDSGSPANNARSPVNSPMTYTGPDVALNAGGAALHPSGEAAGATTTGWTFCNASGTCSATGGTGYTPDVALDSNDGNTSYARSLTNGDRLYMDLDGPTVSTVFQIASVQITAVVDHTFSATGFDIGIRIGPTDFLSGATKTTTASYTPYTGLLYTSNPLTGAPWGWDDINGLVGVVVHQTNNNEIRVTELYLTVNYTPIRLSYPTDPPYFDDGVDPNGGTTATLFNYRIVYTQPFGLAPGGACSPAGPKVYIDGDAGHCMVKDTTSVPTLQDGNFANGEEYIYSTTLSAQGPPHNYYFDISDSNGNTLRIPSSGTLNGPVVSANAPTLSFASQTGYAVQSTGTGTLTAPGSCPLPSNVTGTGTSFTTQLQVGTTITATGGQSRTVTAIAGGACLTTDTPFSPNLSGAAFTYAAWVGAGTLSNASGSTTVTGTGTGFTTQLQIGSQITAAGQTHTVTAIAGDASLTTDTPFSPNLSGAPFTFYTSPALRGVEPNSGTVNTPFTYKIVYTDADNNPPLVGPRLLLDYNTVVYLMQPDTDSTIPASLRDGNYTNGEQYTVTVNISRPGTHAYSFDAFDGVNVVVWPLNGDGLLAPSVTDSIVSGILIYPAGRNVQTTGFTFQGNDTDPSTALDAGYAGNGTITTSGATVTGSGSNFTIMADQGQSLIMAAGQTQVVNTVSNDTSLTTNAAFTPTLASAASWTFDGDYSYARSTNSGDKLYMNMDQVTPTTAGITSVQFFAWVRDAGSQFNFSVGLQIGGTDYTTKFTTPGNGDYAQYAGTLYTTNPKTGAAWSWSDINNLLGVVKKSCFCGKELRVTQMYIQVKTSSLPTLSYSPEAGYNGTDGVDPDGWNPAHAYTYKVVYSNATNQPPVSLQVFIDGVAFNMIHDGPFLTNNALRNGDYTDGEQFYYSTAPGQLAVGPHNYYFLASDGTNTFRLPTSGALPGPNVSVNIPVLSFSSEAGYGTVGVNPASGQSASTNFVYKVVYTHGDNNYPLYVKVHIDGDAGRPMTLDTAAAPTLHDGNYVNGEQYVYTTSLPLGSHTYYFEATDGAVQIFLPQTPSLGILSGPTVTDTSPPSAITNLAINARGTNSTTLTWTAPGNASTPSPPCPCGTVVSYNIRYSTLEIIDDGIAPAVGQINFSNATAVTNPPAPQPAGATETFSVTNLNPNTPYYFAIKSVDQVPLSSSLSNVINSGTTPPVPATNLMVSWSMVSIPLLPSPADVGTVFGSRVGYPVNIQKWVSTGLTGQSGNWHTLSPNDTVQPGIGYFLNSPDDTRYLTAAGAVNTAATFTIPLQQGWNIVGDPYPKDVSLDATCVSRNGGTGTCAAGVNLADFKSFANAVAAGWVGNSLYQWNGINYSFQAYNDPDPTKKAALRLWQGYWLQTLDSVNTYALVIVKP